MMRMIGIVGPAAVLFSIGAVTDIKVPGIYMDAVNPDYMIVQLLNPTSPPIGVWVMPGNFLLHRFPVLAGTIYHGALPFYIGLPSYALFGTGLIGIRLTNMVFGLVVLISAAAVLSAFRVRQCIAASCLGLLALDPGFLFSFRTQFYITALASAMLFLSIAGVQRNSAHSIRSFWLAGLSLGLSCYGYFIYVFAVPIAAVHAVYSWRRASDFHQRVGSWLIGFVLGISPYLIGFFLIGLAVGGLNNFLSFFYEIIIGMQISRSTLMLQGRLLFFWQMLRETLLDVGPPTIMLQEVLPIYAPKAKLLLLLGIPCGVLVVGAISSFRQKNIGPAVSGLLVMARFILSFLVLVLLFGNRLWLHHAVYLLPAVYIALALALDWLVHILPWRLCLGTAILTCLLAPLLITNTIDQLAVRQQLRSTGGVSLASEAITQFAEDSLRKSTPTHMFFPDWGVFMSFAMITHGSIPYSTAFDPAQARRVLCSARDAAVVVVASQDQKRLERWTQAVAWSSPQLTTYSQRNGVPVLIEARWSAASGPSGECP